MPRKLRLAVDDNAPASTRYSTANVQYAALPTPIRTAPASSGSDRRQSTDAHPPARPSRGRRGSSRGSTRAAHHVAPSAAPAKASQALRQLVPATIAIGAASATP